MNARARRSAELAAVEGRGCSLRVRRATGRRQDQNRQHRNTYNPHERLPLVRQRTHARRFWQTQRNPGPRVSGRCEAGARYPHHTNPRSVQSATARRIDVATEHITKKVGRSGQDRPARSRASGTLVAVTGSATVQAAGPSPLRLPPGDSRAPPNTRWHSKRRNRGTDPAQLRLGSSHLKLVSDTAPQVGVVAERKPTSGNEFSCRPGPAGALAPRRQVACGPTFAFARGRSHVLQRLDCLSLKLVPGGSADRPS